MCQIDYEGNEIIQIPAYQTLKARKKSKRLSFEEKKEIFNKINEGVPIRDIKELW